MKDNWIEQAAKDLDIEIDKELYPFCVFIDVEIDKELYPFCVFIDIYIYKELNPFCVFTPFQWR